MTKIRTKQELEAYYAECRQAREQRKLQEREKKRLQALKMKRVDKLQAEREKSAQKAQKQAIIQITIQTLRTPIPIYHSNQFERDSAEEDLYLTREELMQAEERGEGAINWSFWNYLTEKTRNMLNERKEN